MLPRASCPFCVEGAALQAAGALPPGVPFCLEHELPDPELDDGGTAVSGRSGILARVWARWKLRISERILAPFLPLIAVVAAVVAAVWLAWRWPRLSSTVAAAGVCWWLVEVRTAATLLGFATLLQVLAAVALVAPTRCRLWALARWRTLVVYRRLWRRAMHAAELTRRDEDGEAVLPRLGWVRCLDTVDVVRVRGVLGQRGAAWEEAAGMLGHVFGARGVRVHRGDDRRLELELLRGRRGRSWNRDGVLDLEGVR
jgi:hypothetical protein